MIDQIAFYSATEIHSDKIKAVLGLSGAPWVTDRAEMLTRLPPDITWYNAVAEMQFYNELEIIRWIEGPHFTLNNPNIDLGDFFISHYGIHVDDLTALPFGGKLVQEIKTMNHSAPAFHDVSSPQYGRRYHELIIKMSSTVYVKLIKRINHASAP